MEKYPTAIRYLDSKTNNEMPLLEDQSFDYKDIDKYLAQRNYSFVIDETDEFKIILSKLLGDLK